MADDDELPVECRELFPKKGEEEDESEEDREDGVPVD